LLASTYWQLVRDLANSPAKIPEKLAEALQQGGARHFFLSYVILQGLSPVLQIYDSTKTPLNRSGNNATAIVKPGRYLTTALLSYFHYSHTTR